ncbi:hypothetical protein FHG87_010476 [Trinorchestia longiramus]|nr:hypothetical protein FHG87_010476 [Trinorchestia longiramus]
MTTSGGPVLLLVGTLMWTGADRCAAPKPALSSAWLLHVVVLARVFTLIWTSQWLCCGALCVFFLLEVILPHAPSPVFGYLSLEVAVRMTLCSIGLLWLRRALHHCFAICLITYSSVFDKKQRRPITLILTAINIGLMPVLVLLATAAAVLNAPLLPVFTLPCFFLGFPRPERFWPYTVGHSSSTSAAPDAAYYAQLTPYLLSQLLSCLHSGALGLVVAGDHFLLRFEDRLIWIQVLEVGCGHVYFSVKGLELQETSCHTVEASKVDALFSRAFDELSQAPTSSSRLENIVNPSFLHTLTPLCQLPLYAYSDTQNVLTGVIDSVDFLSIINEYFVKCLLFVVMDYAITFKRGRVSVIKPPSRRSYSSRSRHSIASASYDLLSSLPKLSDAVSNQSEPTTSPNLPAGEDLNCSQDTSRPKDGKFELGDDKDNKSVQSGRGSRLAWVDKSKLNSTIESSHDWEQDIFDLSSDKLVMNPDGLRTRNSSQIPAFTKFGSRLSLNRDFPPIAGKSQNFVLTPPNASPASNCAPRRSRSNSTAIQLQQQQIRHQSIDLSEDLDASPTRGGAPATNMTVTSVRVLPRPDPVAKPPPSARVSASDTCALYGPPLCWLDDLPYETEVVDNMQAFFPLSWFKFLLSHFIRIRFEADHHTLKKSSSESERKLSSKSRTKSASHRLKKSSRKKLSGNSGGKRSAALEKYGSVATDVNLPGPTDEYAPHDYHRLLQKLLEDDALEEAYRVVSAVCGMLLCGGYGEDPAPPSPHQVYCTFRGAFLSSTKQLWLNQRPLLRTFALKAYRMAVKISLDHVLIGLNSSSWPDLMDALIEYNSTWFFGSDETDVETSTHRASGHITDAINASNRLLSNTVDGGTMRHSRDSTDVTVNRRSLDLPDTAATRRSLDTIDRVNDRSLHQIDETSTRSHEAAELRRTRRSHVPADRVHRGSLSLNESDDGDLDAAKSTEGARIGEGRGDAATCPEHLLLRHEPLQRPLLDEPQSWIQAIQREVPYLFTIGYNDVKCTTSPCNTCITFKRLYTRTSRLTRTLRSQRVYTSRLAALRVQETGLGRLNSSVVTGVWGALSPELLYLTNDDDERYSIQVRWCCSTSPMMMTALLHTGEVVLLYLTNDDDERYSIQVRWCCSTSPVRISLPFSYPSAQPYGLKSSILPRITCIILTRSFKCSLATSIVHLFGASGTDIRNKVY